MQIINQPYAAGSGTVVHVENGYACALTCGHVFRDERSRQMRSGQLSVIEPGGKPRYAVFLGIDPRTDLAAVWYVASEQTQAVSLTDSETAPGAAVFQLGYPMGHPRSGPPHYRTGAYQGQEPNGELRFTFLPVSGDSGGGIYRAQDGKLLAVVSKRAYPDRPYGWGTGNGGADVQRFLEETCLPWIRRIRDGQPPQPSGPQQPRPGSGPGSNPVPAGPAQPGGLGSGAAPTSTADARLKALEEAQASLQANLNRTASLAVSAHKEIDRIKAAGGEYADRLAKAEAFLGRLQTDVGKTREDIDGARALGSVQAERIDQVKATASEAKDTADKAYVAIGERIGKLGDKLGGIEALAGDAAKAGAWADWLPAIAAGAGTGGAGTAVWLGLAAYQAWRRRSGKVPDGKAIPAAPAMPQPSQVLQLPGDKQDMLLDLLQTLKAQRQQAPPAEPIVRTESKYVPVEKPNGELVALKKAMDEYAQRNPGSIDVIETLKSYAAQIESGQRK